MIAPQQPVGQADELPTRPLAAVILAAGASTRMGSPKALLELPGPDGPETFLDRLIRVLGAHCQPVVAVLGHGAEAIRAGLRRQAVFAENPDPARGQLSSLQCGLLGVVGRTPWPAADPRVGSGGTASGQPSGALFTPVDHAFVSETTVSRLAEAYRTGQHLVVIPEYRGRHGHPVCCAHEIVAELTALPPTAQAREVLHRHRAQTLYLPVDDPGVVLDIDDRETYARALEAARR